MDFFLWIGYLTIFCPEILITDGDMVKAFLLSAVLPAETCKRENDCRHLLRNLVRGDPGHPSNIDLVEELPASDARTSHPGCLSVVKKELNELLERASSGWLRSGT